MRHQSVRMAAAARQSDHACVTFSDPESTNMAGFLTVAGVAGVTQSEVVRALRSYARSKGGKFGPDPSGLSDGPAIARGEPERLSILYPSSIGVCEVITKELSKELKAPAFHFHIHDGDLWMYILFANGKEVDRFNPIPAYWDDGISAAERKRWAGKARTVARHWPGLKPTAIARYLKPW